MVQVSAMLAAVSCLLTYASASPVVGERDADPAAAYTIVDGPIEWKGALIEGGEEVHLTGASIQEIVAKAQALNPAFSLLAESEVAATAPHLVARQTPLTPFTDGSQTAIHCGWPPGWTPTWDFTALHEGIEYMRRMPGDCRAPAGPGHCERVSCSWGSAIYYCNDNRSEHWEPCRWIGDVAAAIVTKCADRDGNGRTLGQAFDQRNWNVIVASGSC
ncbi:hypothetical protein B0T16DRAFT_443880 [Cercophora newfieldiana]|uniref:Uncharacterized protein n=1 Tax=Cercophora newfieldiana TaxID=92897 RepID=A0AA39YKL3_9PEZI|nr:hypothetical protein B0T16DRAFT_443880 [Cercophora newfieldiana]